MALFEHPERYGFIVADEAGADTHGEVCRVFRFGGRLLQRELTIVAHEADASLRALQAAPTRAERRQWALALLRAHRRLAELRGEATAWHLAAETACPACRDLLRAHGGRHWSYPDAPALETCALLALGVPPAAGPRDRETVPLTSEFLQLLIAELDADETRQPA